MEVVLACEQVALRYAITRGALKLLYILNPVLSRGKEKKL
jgi:hypothetical protein